MASASVTRRNCESLPNLSAEDDGHDMNFDNQSLFEEEEKDLAMMKEDQHPEVEKGTGCRKTGTR